MTMIERVARAIAPDAFRQYAAHEAYCLRVGDGAEEAKRSADWAHGADIDKAMMQARAAIEAMREPTYEMKFSEEMAALGRWPEEAEAVWRAMIDYALGEKP